MEIWVKIKRLVGGSWSFECKQCDGSMVESMLVGGKTSNYPILHFILCFIVSGCVEEERSAPASLVLFGGDRHMTTTSLLVCAIPRSRLEAA